MPTRYEAAASSDVTALQRRALLYGLIGCALELREDWRRPQRGAQTHLKFLTSALPEPILRRFPPINDKNVSQHTKVTIATPTRLLRADLATICFIRYGKPVEPNRQHFNFAKWTLRYAATEEPEVEHIETRAGLSGYHTYLITPDFETGLPDNTEQDYANEAVVDGRTKRLRPPTSFGWSPDINQSEVTQLLLVTAMALQIGRSALGTQPLTQSDF